MHDLDMRITVDVNAMYRASTVPLTHGDCLLLKYILAASLYPRVAVPDPNNKQRRAQDCRFNTSTLSELVVHPGSSLAGAVADMSPQEVLLYTELLETRRQYLCGVTPSWALPTLLLSASCLDTDDTGSRWVIDGWLLLRLYDDCGPKLLELVCSLRARVSLLLHQRLARARPRSMEAVCVVDDGLLLWPWQAAAAGDQALHARLMAMPQAARRVVVRLAAEGAVTAAREQQLAAGTTAAPEAEAGPSAAEPGGTEARHREAAESIAAARATAACWGVELDEAGEAGRGPGAVEEEGVANELALMMEAPIRYSLERLAGGLKTTALYRPPNVQQQPPDAAAPAAAAAVGPADIAVDVHGVPKRRAGVSLAAWLRWGSLLSFDSPSALHSLQPALRKHWACPGCGSKVIGTYEDIRQHLDSCTAAQGMDRQRTECEGYQGGEEAADGAQPGPGALQPAMAAARHAGASGSGDTRLTEYLGKRVRWGRRVRREQAAMAEPEGRQPYAAPSGGLPREAQDAAASARPLEGLAGPPSTARPFECPECGFRGELTPVQVLQHNRSHSTAPSKHT